MIDSDRVVSWAEEKLGLKSIGTYEHQEGRIALADALLELRIDTPDSVFRNTITTVESQSEYDLPENLGAISVITWPWDEIRITPVTEEFIHEVRRELSSGEGDYPSEPVFYCAYRKIGQNKLALEPSESIAAGLEIVVDYYPEHYEEPNEGGQVVLAQSLELALKYGTAWHLAEQYAPDRVQYFVMMYEKYKTMYWRRRSFPSHEQYVRPSFEF